MPHPSASDAPPLLVVAGLTKRHGETLAVAGVDLSVAGGEIFGLLGANGAGKTSLVEAIAGLTEPDSGEISIAGIDARADRASARRHYGLSLQATGLPPRLTVREAIALFGSLHGGADISGLATRFGLDDKIDARCETLSGGQRQRLALALALIGDPALVILDEPTAGLDPAIRADFHDLVLSLRAAGRAVLITTHDMAEAMRLCDRVAVMAGGKIVAIGAPKALIQGLAQLRITTSPPLSPQKAAEIAPDFSLNGAETLFSTADSRALLARIASVLTAAGIELVEISSETASLEALIIAIARDHG